jgi:UDP-N-acetylmuramoylalanine--D-glutamate ligase
MPAIILAKHFLHTNEQIQSAIYSFTPLPHRLEYITTLNHILYYNDSLSTTPEATIAALRTFPSRPIHLIAGGHERHQNYSQLAAHILRANVKSVILFPTTGTRLRRTITDLATKKKLPTPHFYPVTTMSKAVAAATAAAQAGDIVLLSPAAASFNSFRDYADRGQQFAQAVHALRTH